VTGIRFRDDEEEGYGDDETAYDDGYGLGFEAYLDHCAPLTV